MNNERVFQQMFVAGMIASVLTCQTVLSQTVNQNVPSVDQLIIKYKVEANLADSALARTDEQMLRLSNAAGVKLLYFRPMSGEAHVLRLPEKMTVSMVTKITNALLRLPEVEYAEPDLIGSPLGNFIEMTPDDALNP
jgi:hypothetical protein